MPTCKRCGEDYNRLNSNDEPSLTVAAVVAVFWLVAKMLGGGW